MINLFFTVIASLTVAMPEPKQIQINPVVADGPRDNLKPAYLEMIRYSSGGVQVPARLFIASGAGLHPTILLLHGFPGTELNLDLARALQRSGWNVLAIHYRGIWGSLGQFSFSHSVEDAHAALAWLRSPAAASFGIDTKRIVAVGHSMGGFDAVMLGDDQQLAGFVLISAADVTRVFSTAVTEEARIGFASTAFSTNATLDLLVADIHSHAADWNWDKRAAGMAGRPVLVLTSDDGMRTTGEAAAQAVSSNGPLKPTIVHMSTDHSFNDHRIALETAIQSWLKTTFDQP